MRARWAVVVMVVCGGCHRDNGPAAAWNNLEAARVRGDGEAVWRSFAPTDRVEMEDGWNKSMKDFPLFSGATAHDFMVGLLSSPGAEEWPMRPIVAEARDGPAVVLTVREKDGSLSKMRMVKEGGRWYLGLDDAAMKPGEVSLGGFAPGSVTSSAAAQ